MKTKLLVLLACVACADEMPRDVQEATAPADTTAVRASPVEDDLAPGPGDLPPGGYVAWIEDMRQELPRVLEEAGEDRGEALDVLRQLYLTRQQPLNDHFGEGGRSMASSEMAQAVDRADEHFQEMMRQLVGTDVPQERLQEAATSLQQALDEVEAAGTAAGLAPTAPRG